MLILKLSDCPDLRRNAANDFVSLPYCNELTVLILTEMETWIPTLGFHILAVYSNSGFL